MENRIVLFIILLLLSCNNLKENDCNDLNEIRNYYKSFQSKNNRNKNYNLLIYKFNDGTNNFYSSDISNNYFIYGTLNNRIFGHYFKADSNYCIEKYSFNLNESCNNYEIVRCDNQLKFHGDPLVANFQDLENNKVEFLISTYLISIKDFKYSFDGKKYETIKLREAEFMPYLSIAELNNCFNKKIYLKLEIKKTQVEIKDYPKVFYDTLYFSKE